MSIVMKFGGSSLASAERIKSIVQIVQSYKEQRPIVVLSALGKTTDMLLDAGSKAVEGVVDCSAINEYHETIANDLGIDSKPIKSLLNELKELLGTIAQSMELSTQRQDHLVSFGERMSVRLISTYAQTQGLNTAFYDAFDLGMITTDLAGNADLLDSSFEKLETNLAALGGIPLITGYIGKDKSGAITTFGRGGSDLTTSLLATAAHATEIQFWKDVNGLLTTDPRMVRNAKPVQTLTFQEAAELSYFGATILHPRSVQPAKDRGIPVRIKNSYNPSHPGTLIVQDDQQPGLRALTYRKNVTLVDIESSRMMGAHGFLAKVFEVFSRLGVSVDLVSTSEVSVTVSLDTASCVKALEHELKEFASVKLLYEKAVVSLVGNVQESTQILARACHALNQNTINLQMLTQGASKANISMIVNADQAEIAIRCLHKEFFE